MLGDRLKELVEQCTSDDVVSIPALVSGLGGEIKMFDGSTVDKGRIAAMEVEDTDDSDAITRRYVFELNRKNILEENNTVLALLLAEYMINYKVPGTLRQNYEIDVFYLRSLRKIRTSRQVILATRLAMPPHIIEQAGEIDFDSFGYARKSNLMQSFIGCAYSDKSVRGILGMIDSVELTHY